MVRPHQWVDLEAVPDKTGVKQLELRQAVLQTCRVEQEIILKSITNEISAIQTSLVLAT